MLSTVTRHYLIPIICIGKYTDVLTKASYPLRTAACGNRLYIYRHIVVYYVVVCYYIHIMYLHNILFTDIFYRHFLLLPSIRIRVFCVQLVQLAQIQILYLQVYFVSCLIIHFVYANITDKVKIIFLYTYTDKDRRVFLFCIFYYFLVLMYCSFAH